MLKRDKTNYLHMLDQIVLTGRPVAITVENSRWFITVQDPEIYTFSDVSLGKAIQAAHRLVFN